MRDAISAYGAGSPSGRQLVAWSRLRDRSLALMIGEQERRERFGYALQQALDARKLSDRALAAQMQIDPRRVARWRTGKGLPDVYETIGLAQILRVSEELFRNPPAVPRPPHYPIEDYLIDVAAEGTAEGLSDPGPDPAADAGRGARPMPPRREGHRRSPRPRHDP